MNLLELLEHNDQYHSKSGRGVGTDKEWRHKYVSTFYNERFEKYKDQPVNLLEVGTGHGGSLIMWSDYFEHGSIFGVDVNDYTDPIIKTYPRIKTSLRDGYTREFADSLPGLDIAIDDGPHTLPSFIKFIDIYLPKVKKDGVLIIEDIPDIEYTKTLAEKVPGYNYEILDTREIANLFDNIMFVVWK